MNRELRFVAIWDAFSGKLRALGWSQRYFAVRSGWSASAVSGWRKSGVVPEPAMRLVEEFERRSRLAAELGADLVPPRGRPRGRAVDGGWEPSATDGAVSDVDLLGEKRRLMRQEQSDMDQDDGSYGRG